MNLESIVGLAGEVFCAEGQVAFMIPPTGIPESIRFDVVGAHGDGGTTEQPVPGMPAWAYIQVGNKFVRMNPEIVQFPFHRLADCLWYAVKLWDRIATPEKGFNKMSFPPPPHPKSQDFAFQRTRLGDGKEIVLIDTWQRLKEHVEHSIRDGRQRMHDSAGRRQLPEM